MNTLTEYQLLRTDNIKRLAECFQFVAGQYGLTEAELKTRKNDVVTITHATWCAMRDFGSFPQIGKAVNRNHASIINAVKNHEGRMKFDRDYRRVFEKVEPIVNAFFEEDQIQANKLQATDLNADLEITKLRRQLAMITAERNQLDRALKEKIGQNEMLNSKISKLRDRVSDQEDQIMKLKTKIAIFS